MAFSLIHRERPSERQRTESLIALAPAPHAASPSRWLSNQSLQHLECVRLTSSPLEAFRSRPFSAASSASPSPGRLHHSAINRALSLSPPLPVLRSEEEWCGAFLGHARSRRVRVRPLTPADSDLCERHSSPTTNSVPPGSLPLPDLSLRSPLLGSLQPRSAHPERVTNSESWTARLGASKISFDLPPSVPPPVIRKSRAPRTYLKRRAVVVRRQQPAAVDEQAITWEESVVSTANVSRESPTPMLAIEAPAQEDPRPSSPSPAAISALGKSSTSNDQCDSSQSSQPPPEPHQRALSPAEGDGGEQPNDSIIMLWSTDSATSRTESLESDTVPNQDVEPSDTIEGLQLCRAPPPRPRPRPRAVPLPQATIKEPSEGTSAQEQRSSSSPKPERVGGDRTQNRRTTLPAPESIRPDLAMPAVLARVASAGVLRRRASPLSGAEDETRQKLMELELEHIGKYKWRPDCIVPAISARLAVHPAFLEELANCCPASAVPKPNPKPDLNPPTEHLALIITVGCFADPTLSALPQATADGATLKEVLAGLGFTVRHLTTASIERHRAAVDHSAQLKSQTPWTTASHNPAVDEADVSQLPTKANIMREVSRALRLHRGNHIASLLVIFSGRGLVHNALEVSDSPAKLLACYDTKPSLFSSYFPVEVLSAIRLERTLTVADLAPFHPNNGLGFVAADVVGGRLEFQYPPLQGFNELIGGRSSLLMGLMIRGFRGKAARDLRLTPNNFNVYAAQRLMALKWKLFTSANALQAGAWDMAPRAAVFSQRETMRAFRETKRRRVASFRARGLVSHYSARNFPTVASQIQAKFCKSAEISLGEDCIELTTPTYDGRLYLAFQSKEAYALDVVEAEGHFRRALPNAIIMREPIHLRLAVRTENTSQQTMTEVVTVLAEHRQRKGMAAVVLVGVEVQCVGSVRAARKFDWAARAGHFAPTFSVETVEISEEKDYETSQGGV